MVAAGADLIDVGGESTRPGGAPVSEAVELARVVPVVRALAAALPAPVPLSIDTYKAGVAAAALSALCAGRTSCACWRRRRSMPLESCSRRR